LATKKIVLKLFNICIHNIYFVINIKYFVVHRSIEGAGKPNPFLETPLLHCPARFSQMTDYVDLAILYAHIHTRIHTLKHSSDTH